METSLPMCTGGVNSQDRHPTSIEAPAGWKPCTPTTNYGCSKSGSVRYTMGHPLMRSIESDERMARTAMSETMEFRYSDQMEGCASGSAPLSILMSKKG